MSFPSDMTAPPAGALEACLALLPCPWCGAEMGPATVSEGSTFRWRKVDGCCADGPEVRHNTMADDQAAAEVESARKAIEAWNTRPALLAALRLREWCEAWMRRIEREADAHTYFADNADLRMTASDHAKHAAQLTTIRDDLARVLEEWG